ncbi:MAG: hypothetical protein H6832_02945 [Planctomycetes bacterium]|nr:hypothetical protein [Planctomycetota bacterium]
MRSAVFLACAPGLMALSASMISAQERDASSVTEWVEDVASKLPRRARSVALFPVLASMVSHDNEFENESRRVSEVLAAKIAAKIREPGVRVVSDAGLIQELEQANLDPQAYFAPRFRIETYLEKLGRRRGIDHAIVGTAKVGKGARGIDVSATIYSLEPRLHQIGSATAFLAWRDHRHLHGLFRDAADAPIGSNARSVPSRPQQEIELGILERVRELIAGLDVEVPPKHARPLRLVVLPGLLTGSTDRLSSELGDRIRDCVERELAAHETCRRAFVLQPWATVGKKIQRGLGYPLEHLYDEELSGLELAALRLDGFVQLRYGVRVDAASNVSVDLDLRITKSDSEAMVTDVTAVELQGRADAMEFDATEGGSTIAAWVASARPYRERHGGRYDPAVILGSQSLSFGLRVAQAAYCKLAELGVSVDAIRGGRLGLMPIFFDPQGVGSHVEARVSQLSQGIAPRLVDAFCRGPLRLVTSAELQEMVERANRRLSWFRESPVDDVTLERCGLLGILKLTYQVDPFAPDRLQLFARLSLHGEEWPLVTGVLGGAADPWKQCGSVLQQLEERSQPLAEAIVDGSAAQEVSDGMRLLLERMRPTLAALAASATPDEFRLLVRVRLPGNERVDQRIAQQLQHVLGEVNRHRAKLADQGVPRAEIEDYQLENPIATLGGTRSFATLGEARLYLRVMRARHEISNASERERALSDIAQRELATGNLSSRLVQTRTDWSALDRLGAQLEKRLEQHRADWVADARKVVLPTHILWIDVQDLGLDIRLGANLQPSDDSASQPPAKTLLVCRGHVKSIREFLKGGER